MVFKFLSKFLSSSKSPTKVIKPTPKNISMIGIPFKHGQPKDGVCCGPDFLRKAGIIECLCKDGINIKDEGNISYCPTSTCHPPPNMNNYDHVIANSHKVSKKQECLALGGGQLLAIGGDHSTAIGTIHGLGKVEKSLCVIWIDAHADINTNISSPSGNIHGMPLAFLTKEVFEHMPELPNMEWFCPVLGVQNLAYIGSRDFDPYEKQVVEACCIPSYTPCDVRTKGVETVMKEILSKIDPKNDRKIYVSFDVDGMDPCFAPSTGTPVGNGISLEESIKIMEFINKTGRFKGMDVVEFNPEIGSCQDVRTTAKSIYEILKAAFK